MNEHFAWDEYAAPLYNARLDNADTIAQRLEEALTRRAHRSHRRYCMRRYDGPHNTYPRRDQIAAANEDRRTARLLRTQLADEVTDATTPTTIPEPLCLSGPAENYISGVYPYFSTEQALEIVDDTNIDNGWDDAFSIDDWHNVDEFRAAENW